jgi:quercetin dioxygenase-like cupin family protein
MADKDGASSTVGTRLIAEDEQVRLWTIDLEPGEEAPLHTHRLDYTSVVIEGDAVARLNADGSVERLAVQPGDVTRWYQSTQTHGLRNIGTRRFRNIIVEVKGASITFG